MNTIVDTNIAFPQMAESHPDLDQATLPSIPPEWTDVSWHNDTCPSFNAHDKFIVFIDYPASYQREFEGPRFSAHTAQNGQIDFLSEIATDSWVELLEWINK